LAFIVFAPDASGMYVCWRFRHAREATLKLRLQHDPNQRKILIAQRSSEEYLMPKPARGLLFLAALYLLGTAWPIHAAKPAAGSLTGVVLNLKGAPVRGARVFWATADGSLPHTLHTDANGRFRVPSMRPGLYEVRGEAGGMWSEWEHNVLVRAGAESKITLRLVRETPPSTISLRDGSARTSRSMATTVTQ
jgi:hypothetical protein